MRAVLAGLVLLFASTFAATNETRPALVYLIGERVAVRMALGAKPRLFGKGREPVFTKDGKHVVFWRDGEHMNCPIASLDLGTGKATVIQRGNTRAPRCSPDGTWLAFTRYDDDSPVPTRGWHLYVARWSILKQLIRLTNSRYAFNPRWLPSSGAIVVQDLDRVSWIGLDGRTIRTRTVREIAGRNVDTNVAFDPCPTAPHVLLFQRWATPSRGLKKLMDDPNQEWLAIYTFDERTGVRARLTPPSVYAEQPCWSRDGKFIYFVGYRERDLQRGADCGIFRVTRGGRQVSRIGDGDNEPST